MRNTCSSICGGEARGWPVTVKRNAAILHVIPSSDSRSADGKSRPSSAGDRGPKSSAAPRERTHPFVPGRWQFAFGQHSAIAQWSSKGVTKFRIAQRSTVSLHSGRPRSLLDGCRTAPTRALFARPTWHVSFSSRSFKMVPRRGMNRTSHFPLHGLLPFIRHGSLSSRGSPQRSHSPFWRTAKESAYCGGDFRMSFR